MIGVIYLRENNLIISMVDDVVAYTDVDMIGRQSQSKGIDRSKADFVIVESTDLQLGDTIDLTQITDVRHNIPETPEQKAARLEIEKKILEERFNNLNTEFSDFMDYYFSNQGV